MEGTLINSEGFLWIVSCDTMANQAIAITRAASFFIRPAPLLNVSRPSPEGIYEYFMSRDFDNVPLRRH